MAVDRGIGRQAGETAARQVHQPNVAVALYRSIDRDVASIRRQFRSKKIVCVRLTGHAHVLARPVEPSQLPPLGAAGSRYATRPTVETEKAPTFRYRHRRRVGHCHRIASQFPARDIQSPRHQRPLPHEYHPVRLSTRRRVGRRQPFRFTSVKRSQINARWPRDAHRIEKKMTAVGQKLRKSVDVWTRRIERVTAPARPRWPEYATTDLVARTQTRSCRPRSTRRRGRQARWPAPAAARPQCRSASGLSEAKNPIERLSGDQNG